MALDDDLSGDGPVSLDLNSSASSESSGPATLTYNPIQPVKKSSTLAFVLSLIFPGLGQVYCGQMRGVTTLIFSAAGLAGVYFLADGTGQSELFFGIAFRVTGILYVFAFLDAYFTATELSDGTYSLITEHPRVAAVLNLISLSFGYFYIRQKKKGMVMMAVG